jgi:putative membrane protein
MSAPRFTRRRASVVFTGLFVPAATFLLMPGSAVAALAEHSASPIATPSTVQASIGAGGAVKSAMLIANNGSINSFAGQLPLTMTISSTVAGAARTTNYRIENTSGQQQKVTWKLPDGKLKSATVNVQLPLVGHLLVSLPRTAKDIEAPDAAITTNSDGTHTLDWSLVMFSPLGNPVQDVAFTATGSGAPGATLHASLVSPTSAPGLSATAQNANQSVAQTGTWSAEASGADKGLSQLSTGVGALVTGLQQLATGAGQLHDGLAPALTGAQQLDAGSHQALSGAQRLSGGLGTIHAGQESLTSGLNTIHQGQASLTSGLNTLHAGQRSLTGGLSTIHTGQKSLTGGLSTIHSGQQSLTGGLSTIHTGQHGLTGGLSKILTGQHGLTGGLSKILSGQHGLTGGLSKILSGQHDLTVGLSKLSGGLQQLAGSAGLPHAVAGAQQLKDGVDALLQQVPPGPLHDALQHISDGLGSLIAGLQGATGVVNLLSSGAGDALAGSQKLETGTGDALAGSQKLETGTGDALEGSQKLDTGTGDALAGSQKLETGTGDALAGSQKLTAGSGDALAGSQKLTVGTGTALAGSQKLTAGSAAAASGSQKLTAGSAAAASGSQKLTAGSGQAFGGSKKLVTGLSAIAAGEHQTAVGLPAAISGSQQIADGLLSALSGGKQIHAGVGQVKKGAVHPLSKQIKGAGSASLQQIAILTAGTDRANAAPGGPGRTYVLTQAPNALHLASFTGSRPGGSDRTGREIVLGAGAGLLVLALGVFGGLLIGRRRVA